MIPLENPVQDLQYNEDITIGKEVFHCTPLMVLKSAAGYYIGRLCRDKNRFVEPFNRESDYFPTFEAASKELSYVIKEN